MMDAAVQKEGLRQQMLLRALLRDARPGVVALWLRDAPDRATRGLQAYQANALALAERALAAAFPTIAKLIGESAFTAVARALWRTDPPARGDVAQWGAQLPAFLAQAEQLASEPYLADVARLEWALHEAEGAADTPAASQGLELLASADPATLLLLLRPGSVMVDSPYPIATLWHAHRIEGVADDERFAPVRAAFATGQGEHALVWRAGFKAQVAALSAADARFSAALLARRPLADALLGAGEDFAFEPWLIAALRQGWLAAVSNETIKEMS